MTAARIRLRRCLVKGNRFTGTRTPSAVESPRRRLQSVQLMSTTTNHPIPGTLLPMQLAQLALDDGVEAPSATQAAVPGDAGTSTLVRRSRHRGAHRELPAGISRFDPSQGNCSSVSLFSPRESALPNPTRPGTSRHGTVVASAGNRSHAPHRRPGQSRAVEAVEPCGSNDPATRAACRHDARGPPLRSARAERAERHLGPRAAAPVAPRRAASTAAP